MCSDCGTIKQMKDETRRPTKSSGLAPVLAALIAALTLLFPHATRLAIAQTESSTALPAPALPAPALTATAAGAHAIDLSWTAVPGAVRYELWTWTDAAGWHRLDDGSLTAATFTHGALTAGTTYWYAVLAVAADGTTSDWSEHAHATATGSSTATPTPTPMPPAASGTSTPTPPPTSTPTDTPNAPAGAVPAAPNLTARATPGGVTLSWNAVAGAVRYELWTWWDAGVSWQAIGGNNLTGTTYTHADVTAGTTYYYSIRALNAAGDASAWLEPYPSATAQASTESGTATPSATATPTSTSTPTSPAQPTRTPTPTATGSAGSVPTTPNLTAAATTGGILLSWDAVAHAVRYELWTWWDAGVGWQAIGGNNLTGTSYTHADVAAGATYYYSIRALNASGETSAWLEPYPFATAPAPAGAGTPTPTPTATATPTAAVTERTALTALYNAAGGSNWTRNDNWLSGQPLSTWYGVSTDANGRVTELRLGGNGLRGTIPELSALANLEELYLASNLLTGAVPALNAFPKLKVMDLSRNRLTGPIPELSALARIERLSLARNRLTGSIPDLSALANLTNLDLESNRLTGPIPDLSALVNLKGLVLGTNRLSGPVPELGALVNLVSLALQHNLLSGPLPDLRVLPNLRQLNLTANRFCLPAGRDATGLHSAVAAHLHTLNLAPCTDAGTPTATATAGPSPTPTATPTATAAGASTSAPTPTPTVTSTPPPADADAQRAALVALYNAAGGANWTRNDNWLSGQPLSTWYGVTTDGGGRVTRLSLSHNRLRGPLPDLGALASLTHLSLHSNELRGPLPDLSALANLESLSLSYNELSGPIPNLGALANLTHLSLYQNDLSGPIPDLSALANLESLSLSGNQLSGAIPDLSALTNLTVLSLGANDLSGTIQDLSALTNLERLSLYENELSGTIPDLSALANLESLLLHTNRLSGPVPDLSALANLTDLSLARNHLCLPEDADLSDLNDDLAARVLDLFLPSCTGAPARLPASSPAERAALVALYNATDGPNWTNNGNWLTDAPVAAWYGVTVDGRGRVTRLSLRENGLSGSIPDLSGLANLTDLHLGANDLSGPIPDLSALVNLEFLVLGTNRLSGQIPDLSALVKLEELHLYTNQLSGPIPDLSALANLEVLSLSYNQLSGPIPDLSALTNLWDLSLYNNRLTGPVPDLNALANLWYVELDSNQLTGPIPDLSALASLRELSLSHNDLTGSIPDLSALANLTNLSLHSNDLTGSIPDLGALARLKTLSLSHNMLSGPIPDLNALANLSRLSLNVNQLSGPIPDLSALANLRTLRLSHNDLTGPVPDLSPLARLTGLSLANNRLCLPTGADLSGANQVVADHLESLNLPACTASELPSLPGTPQNLAATVSAGQVTLAWDAVANAASYELWAWDGVNRAWGRIGGALTATSYTHPVLTDGRNYYFQVRAWDANNVRGAWSQRVFAAVVPQQFLPPPPSLGVNPFFYQKYANVDGIGLLAPAEISDEQIVRGREIITGMLTGRPDLLATLVAHDTLVFIDPFRSRGIAFKFDDGWEAYIPEEDPVPHCGTFIHELGHLIHFALEEQAGGDAFNARLRAAYQTARTAGRWRGMYAMTNVKEYWAEMARMWLWEALPPSLQPYYSDLAAYDPEAAALVEEIFDDAASVPAACKP